MLARKSASEILQMSLGMALVSQWKIEPQTTKKSKQANKQLRQVLCSMEIKVSPP